MKCQPQVPQVIGHHYPLVSIITPSYNQGHFIVQTIESVRKQDYPNIEHIVIDGGSTDNTVEILSANSDYIQWISEPDNGQSDAINKGFRLARGEIIGWLNSDDVYFYKNVISTIVMEFLTTPDIDFIYGDFVTIDQYNFVLKVYHRWPFSFDRLIRMCYISQPATFFQTRVVNKIQLDPGYHYGMDIEFWLRAASMGYSFRHISKLLAAERIHGAAKSIAGIQPAREEGVRLRIKYASPSAILNINRSDKVLLLFSKLKGFATLLSIRRNSDLAFSAQYESVIKMALRQINLVR